MRNDLWINIRRMLRRDTPSTGISQIVDNWSEKKSPDYPRTTQRRERLDLMRGWVTDTSARPTSPEPHQIVDDWRAQESSASRRAIYKRERLDLMRGWVADNPAHASNDGHPQQSVRRAARGRTRAT